jgi:hydrogenase maturation protein HypF
MEAETRTLIQQRIRVRGAVQGVGFRPQVYRLAQELGLAGWVRNDGAGVEILVGGTPLALARFVERLQAEPPPLARIDALEVQDEEGAPLSAAFRIEASGGGPVSTGVSADAAVCDACLAELFTPADRRWRYPFLNCTHCGPRYTITARLPYDRANTSMARFAMCAACAAEYHDPADRRFHAQPTACPVCGPRLALWDVNGSPLAVPNVIAEALRLIAGGGIVALKGLGGFHLVCDARNADAVARLRLRKQRDEKPFAVMTANVASAAAYAVIDEPARLLLPARERPIVLLRKRPGCDERLPGVAPGLSELGLMLPYTPLHWLLFHEAAGRPTGTVWTEAVQPLALVMTSANPGGEPLVIGNEEAVHRLGDIADVFVVHDRGIVVRCDDSVVRPTGDLRTTDDNRQQTTDHFTFIRRARGYTPAPIRLPAAGPPVLATGSYLKTTACLTRGDEAFLSQHIGDLDNAASCLALEEAIEHLQAVLEIRPQAVAHDLHPDNFGTRLAQQLATAWNVPALPVQHHHAHIAAVVAEHRFQGPVIGLALDGVGHGDDGGAWGGELLRVAGARCERLGPLRALPLPGGDRAAREPWRMAAAALHLLGRADEIETRFAAQPAAAAVAQMLTQELRSPLTSSMGRWFDAAAGLLGIRAVMAYEGQAAMLLEGLAAQHGPVAPDNALYKLDRGTLDLLPLAARLADETDAAFGAALFHATLAAALAEWAAAAARAADLTTIALGGGCFLNRLLSLQLPRLLAARGYTVLQAWQAPPNDGGISLGQAWVALERLRQGV